jgi:hypothetical protein
VLVGDNEITSAFDGITDTFGMMAGGEITITGDGSLTSTGGKGHISDGIRGGGSIILSGNVTLTAAGGAGVTGSYGISLFDDLIICDNATVNATGFDGSYSCGLVMIDGSLKVSDNATVTATGGTAGVNGSFGIYMLLGGSIALSGNATVNATSGAATLTCGISNNSNITFSDSVTVTATGGTGADSYGISAPSGGITINGGTVTAIGDKSAFATDYTVPAGYIYWVNDITSAPGGAETVSDGTDVIGSSHKYAKIIALPTVVDVTPSGNGAAISGHIVITFDRAMDTTFGTVQLNSLAALAGGSWSDGDTKFTIPYSGLSYNTSYTVNISEFKDAEGNEMVADSTHSFTTMLIPVSFTAVQTGGTSGTADSTGIVITFDSAVTGLTASDIIITNDTGSVTEGALSGSGTTWTIALSDVETEGDVTVSITDFGLYNVTTGAQTVAVYKDTSEPAGDSGLSLIVLMIVVAAEFVIICVALLSGRRS